jgi:DNA-binding transcriptional ArsR family regulator
LTTTALVEEDALWAAVADPTRRRVLDALLEHGEATTTTLAKGLPVTRQAVAKHLVVLDRVGLVAGQRRGREVRYAVRPERLDDAAEALARVAAQWDRRLARIKRLAESAQAEGHAPGADRAARRVRTGRSGDRFPTPIRRTQ